MVTPHGPPAESETDLVHARDTYRGLKQGAVNVT